MINEKEKIENPNEKDSGSEVSEHSLDGFHDNVSESEHEEEKSQINEEQNKNINLEEDSAKIEMRCG